jgi:mxaK protein
MRRAVPMICCALLVAIAIEGYRLVRIYSLNEAIREKAVAALEDSGRPEAEFAQAYFAAAKGETEKALALYQRVANAAPSPLSTAAQYNSANVLLRSAIETSKLEGEPRAHAIFAMAKETYRAVLRRDPAHWDAKYNFERALRLSPELIDGEVIGQNAGAERSVTTMRGFTLGLP